MRDRIKRSLTAAIAALMLFTSVPQIAYANPGSGMVGAGTGAATAAGDGIGDAGGSSGGGSTGGSTDGNSSWSMNQQGYRFVIADQSLTPVSNVVDILFSGPKSGDNYFNSRATPLSSDTSNYYLFKMTWTDLAADSTRGLTGAPPHAIGWNGGPVGMGLAFKDWFMGTNDYIGGPVEDYTGGDTTGGVTGDITGGTGGTINKPSGGVSGDLASKKRDIDARIAESRSKRMEKHFADRANELRALFNRVQTMKQNELTIIEKEVINFYSAGAMIQSLNMEFNNLFGQLRDAYGNDKDAWNYALMKLEALNRFSINDLKESAFSVIQPLQIKVLDAIEKRKEWYLNHGTAGSTTNGGIDSNTNRLKELAEKALQAAYEKKKQESLKTAEDKESEARAAAARAIDAETERQKAAEAKKALDEYNRQKKEETERADAAKKDNDTSYNKTSTSTASTKQSTGFSGSASTQLIIPLAEDEAEAADASNYVQVMGLQRDDGTALFQLDGFTPTVEYNIVDEMQDKNYIILVEPILWLRPTGLSSTSGADVNNTYGKYVYGTIGNIADWYKENNNNTRYGGNGKGGWFASILGLVGWQCMLTEVDWAGTDGGSILALTNTGTSASVTIAQMQEKMAAGESVALHLYTANEFIGIKGTQTFDPTSPDPEHKAPVPPTPPTIPDKGTDTNDGGDGGTPDSPDTPAGGTPDKQYKINIIKFYEEDSLPISNHTRNENPSTIKIMDEPTGNYVVDAWAISPDYMQPSSQSDTYFNTISKVTSTSDGTTPTTVNITDPNTTLYIKLIKVGIPFIVINDLVIRESQVVKAVATADSITTDKGLVWGPRVWGYVYGDIGGSAYHGCTRSGDCSKHSCNSFTCSYNLKDSDYSYTFVNSTVIRETLLANKGAFVPKHVYGASASGNVSGTGGGTNKVDTYNYEMSLWRGDDEVTIAGYKAASNANAATLKGLVGLQANKPLGARKPNRPYFDLLDVTLSDNSPTSDYLTTSKCSKGSHGAESTHTTSSSELYIGTVTIEVYSGLTKALSKAIPSSTKPPVISHVGSTAKEGSGRPVNSMTGGKMLRFYPYINMTYQLPGSPTAPRHEVPILSQYERGFTPQDYAEAGWYNKDEINLNLNSSQWSLHQKAINPTDTGGTLLWSNQSDDRKNNVLPGGAMYTLDTKSTESVVAAVTWQTYINAAERAALSLPIDANELTVAGAKAEHTKYIDTTKKVLEGLRVVQYVDKNSKADNAFTSGTPILGGGQSLSTLGLPNTTNSDLKYYPKADTSANQAYEGDIDIIRESTKEVYYGVRSDTSGIVHIMRSTSPEMTSATTIETLAKGKNAKTLTTAEAIELDEKTKLITNFVESIERNTGKDTTAAWAPDGKWYNEAWDGFCVMRQETALTVGFKSPGVRSSALDPALCPANSGQSDLFTKAFLSQFRMNSVSDANEASGKETNYISTFKGTDIKMVGMENIFVSKKFWIPNVNVQDLK